MSRENAWIQTYTGRKFFFYDDLPAVDIRDVAHSLPMMCRFTGHCSDFWSVGQHSLLVSYLTGLIYDTLDLDAKGFLDDAFHGQADLMLIGLLHDSTEAYMADINTPLKRTLSEYTLVEHALYTKIADHFKLSVSFIPDIVKYADRYALRIEYENLFPNPDPTWTLPERDNKIHDAADEAFKHMITKSFKRVERDFLNMYKMLENYR
jgi:hypothetical protein